MVSKILVHPGFHKTGTTSLQRGLQSFRDVCGSRLLVLLTDEMREATHLAKRYSVQPDERRLIDFGRKFASCVEAIDPSDLRPLLISSEALTGQIPGRNNVTAYDAAPDLLERIVIELRKRFPTEASITVWFTTRNVEDWKRSAYFQNLRSTRLTEDFETHWLKLERAARLDEIVDLTQARLKDKADVCSSRIEDCGGFPSSSLQVALNILKVRNDGLAPTTFQNVQPKNAAQKLLELNRSSLDDDTLSATKRELLRHCRKKGFLPPLARELKSTPPFPGYLR